MTEDKFGNKQCPSRFQETSNKYQDQTYIRLKEMENWKELFKEEESSRKYDN